MKQRFKTGVGAFVLCVVLLLAGALPVCAVKAHPVPDSGMTLDTSELLLELTSEDPAPVAYLTVQAPNDYFFLIWTSRSEKSNRWVPAPSDRPQGQGPHWSAPAAAPRCPASYRCPGPGGP